MKIGWLPEAVRSLDSQIDYIATRNPHAAVAVRDAIEAAISRLADHPAIGPAGRVGGTRELVVNGTPHILVYRIEPRAIVILRVLHGAQRWPPLKRVRQTR